jgi:hypothetical protein
MTAEAHHCLYYGKEIVATVAGDYAMPEHQVRQRALDSHERIPLCDWPFENPWERRWKILCSARKVYPVGPR